MEIKVIKEEQNEVFRRNFFKNLISLIKEEITIKQNKITGTGILKVQGNGSVSANYNTKTQRIYTYILAIKLT